MSTTIIWTTLLGVKVAIHIHAHALDNLTGRYAVSRLWPGELVGQYWCVALWPIGDGYAGDCATVCLDANGRVITEREWRRARFAVALPKMRELWAHGPEAVERYVAGLAA
jgi:hypothetical protein